MGQPPKQSAANLADVSHERAAMTTADRGKSVAEVRADLSALFSDPFTTYFSLGKFVAFHKDRILAALAAASPASGVTEEWLSVPKDPTRDMIEAACREVLAVYPNAKWDDPHVQADDDGFRTQCVHTADAVWRSMIAALIRGDCGK